MDRLRISFIKNFSGVSLRIVFLSIIRYSSIESGSLHYRLRAIRVINFTSHFYVIQIIQILFSPSVSFYTHPNISYIFGGDEINLFMI